MVTGYAFDYFTTPLVAGPPFGLFTHGLRYTTYSAGYRGYVYTHFTTHSRFDQFAVTGITPHLHFTTPYGYVVPGYVRWTPRLVDFVVRLRWWLLTPVAVVWLDGCYYVVTADYVTRTVDLIPVCYRLLRLPYTHTCLIPLF